MPNLLLHFWENLEQNSLFQHRCSLGLYGQLMTCCPYGMICKIKITCHTKSFDFNYTFFSINSGCGWKQIMVMMHRSCNLVTSAGHEEWKINCLYKRQKHCDINPHISVRTISNSFNTYIHNVMYSVTLNTSEQ